MNRSDYMVSGDSNKPLELAAVKQVEFNTMASGAGGLSQALNGWHKLVKDAIHVIIILSYEFHIKCL